MEQNEQILNPAALKAALLSSQAWWEDMGVDCDAIPIPKTAKKRTAQKSKATSANTDTSSAIANAPKPHDTAASVPLKAPLTPNPASQKQAQDILALAVSQAKAAPTLEALKTVVENFDAGLLSDHAVNTLFSRGPAPATQARKIMVIGETPTGDDDHANQLFSGARGALLDKMFAAIGHAPADIYCTSISPWRTPSDRALSDEETALCLPFLRRHIQLYEPQIVVLAGSGALKSLCGTTSIMKSQGQWQTIQIDDNSFQAMPLYPPQTLLQRPALKKQAWRALLTIQAHLQHD